MDGTVTPSTGNNEGGGKTKILYLLGGLVFAGAGSFLVYSWVKSSKDAGDKTKNKK